MSDTPTVTRIEEDDVVQTSADELLDNSDLTSDDVALAEETAAQDLKGRPAVTLTGYQKLIVTAQRKFISMCITRQGGKTFGCTLRTARVTSRIPNHRYHILSRSERQSGNAIAQTAVHLQAVDKALSASGKRIGGRATYTRQKLRYHRDDGSALEYRRLSINLPNGSKVIGLPSTPDTCVGISGSANLDEFAVHRNNREVYSRLFPIVSRRPEYELVISSTPRGIGDKFHEIMTSPDFADIFFRVVIDIFTAVQQGLVLYDYEGKPITDDEGIEKLRKALKDDDSWNEEYLVKFLDDLSHLLTHELIARCERLHNADGKEYKILEMPEDFDPSRDSIEKLIAPYLSGKGGRLFAGFDQARRRHLSALWIDEEESDLLWCRAMLVMQNKDFEFQEQVLWQALSMPKMTRAGIDATGLGMRTAERAVTRFGGLVVSVDFSSTLKDKRGQVQRVKALIARVMLERHQDGKDRYPVIDAIRSDFHKVKRIRSGSPDSFSYEADDDATGHSDIFTAAALSKVVAQEMSEYGGRVDVQRIGGDEPINGRRAFLDQPDNSEDYAHANDADWRLV